MKKNILLLLAAAALAAFAQDEGLAVKPMQYTFTTLVPENLPQRPMPFRSGNQIGCEVTYCVTGGDVTEVDTSSVAVTSVTSQDGRDLSIDRRGRTAWRCGRPSLLFDDNFAAFNVFVAAEGLTAFPIIKGTVTVKVAGKVETETLTFKTDGKGKEQKAGGLVFSIANAGTDADDDAGHADGRFTILMKGDMRLVSGIAFTAGGKRMKHYGPSWGGKASSPTRSTPPRQRRSSR